jgi:hypothetical protein
MTTSQPNHLRRSATDEAPLQGQAPPPAGGLTFEALQAQFASQAQQLAVLQAQVRVIQNRMNVTSPGPELAALTAQRAPLDDQILKLQIDMAATRAQLASRMGISAENLGANGRPNVGRPNFDFQRRGPDPDAVVGMSFALVIAVAFPLAIAYARRIWRGKPSASALADTVSPRLDRLEQAVDSIAIEIERVAEGQRFVTKVLAERPAQAQTQMAPESPIARDAASALGDAKPFLALGAGPIEPIRVPDRQAVRPSITPH